MISTKKIISFLGVPCGVGGRILGCEDAPDFLRSKKIYRLFEPLGFQVEDQGDVSPVNLPSLNFTPGFHQKPLIAAWCQATQEVVEHTLNAQKFPFVLGGEHSIAIGTLSGVSRYCHAHGKKLFVLWLDAHADFNTPETSYSGNIHGMPAAILCGDGDPDLCRIVGKEYYLFPSHIYQIGLRSVDEKEKIRLHERGIHAYSMQHLDQLGIYHILNKILSFFETQKNVHLHLSFDVDFLDGDLAPAVGTREPGGPSFREARLCFEMIAQSGLLGSMEIVEYNPRLDADKCTQKILFDLLPFLFGKTLI